MSSRGNGGVPVPADRRPQLVTPRSRREEHGVLLAAVRLDLAAVGGDLPHAEVEAGVDVGPETARADDLDAGEDRLADQHRGGEAGVVDTDAVPAPALADEPGAVHGDDAGLAGEADRELAGQVMGPGRGDALLAHPGVVDRDGLLEAVRPIFFRDERVDMYRRVGA